MNRKAVSLDSSELPSPQPLTQKKPGALDSSTSVGWNGRSVVLVTLRTGPGVLLGGTATGPTCSVFLGAFVTLGTFAPALVSLGVMALTALATA